MLMPIMISMTRFYHNSKPLSRFNSVLFHNSVTYFFAAFLVVLVAVTSCVEKPTVIGIHLLPAKDFVNIKDTTRQVEVVTINSTPLKTNSRPFSYLGRLGDPYFGETITDFVGQLRLDKQWNSDNTWPAGEIPNVDSVRLLFSIAGAQGLLDSTTTHMLKIYEINEALNSDLKYYSDRDAHAVTKLSNVLLPVITKDTVQTLGMRIDKSIGTRLLNDPTKLSQDRDGNPFKSYFNGLYITTGDSIPLLLALSFTQPNFIITVYYQDSQTVPHYFDFYINASSVRYNRYSYRYNKATSPDSVKLNRIRAGAKDSLVYLQAFNGVHPQIKMAGLKGIKSMLWDSVRNIPKGSINKARLTFSVFLDDNTFTPITVPPQILMKFSIRDSVYVVPDYQVSSNFFDGKFNSTNITYSFNLASFVQEYIKGKIPDPVVEMFLSETEFRNVILKANSSHSPVKFEFTYTKF